MARCFPSAVSAVRRLTEEDLIANRALTPQMLDVLKSAVQARLNIIVSGGTGAGKTTLLNVLSGFISERERIVTIEDSAELRLKQAHVVRLECRPPNVEGKGAIRQRELVINALRMRPDRIVVGEVRGEEALDMLQAMNTGHDGSITTVHANSPRDALSRIETMSLMGDINLPDKAIRAQIASAVQHHHPDFPHERRLAPRDPRHRGDRHQRRRDQPAGHLPVREARGGTERQGAGTLPLDRHRAQVCGEAEGAGVPFSPALLEHSLEV